MKTNVDGSVTISVELFDKYRKAYEDAPCIMIKHQWSGGFCGCDENVIVLNTGEKTKFIADLMRDSEDDEKRVEKHIKTINELQEELREIQAEDRRLQMSFLHMSSHEFRKWKRR